MKGRGIIFLLPFYLLGIDLKPPSQGSCAIFSFDF